MCALACRSIALHQLSLQDLLPRIPRCKTAPLGLHTCLLRIYCTVRALQFIGHLSRANGHPADCENQNQAVTTSSSAPEGFSIFTGSHKTLGTPLQHLRAYRHMRDAELPIA